MPLDRMYSRTYTNEVDFEWDRGKATANLRKHGVDFADAVGVFSDPLAATIADRYRDEERFITIGTDTLGQLLVVVYTWRVTRIRIISAREATRHERRHYEA